MHAGLMRLYAFSERRGEALAQYERLRGSPTQGSWMHRSAQLPSGFVRRSLPAHSRRPSPPFAPTEEPSDAGKHNLPASRTSFVGREHEMMEIKRHLAMTRLLTLTGAGGSGKTRLALEGGKRARRRLPRRGVAG